MCIIPLSLEGVHSRRSSSTGDGSTSPSPSSLPPFLFPSLLFPSLRDRLDSAKTRTRDVFRSLSASLVLARNTKFVELPPVPPSSLFLSRLREVDAPRAENDFRELGSPQQQRLARQRPHASVRGFRSPQGMFFRSTFCCFLSLGPLSLAMSKPLVLVTGASGYVGASVVHAFLRAGYRVRGTVRKQAQAGAWRYRLPHYDEERLDFAIVEDMGREGAYDEAIKDVEVVVHTASPFFFGAFV